MKKLNLIVVVVAVFLNLGCSGGGGGGGGGGETPAPTGAGDGSGSVTPMRPIEKSAAQIGFPVMTTLPTYRTFGSVIEAETFLSDYEMRIASKVENRDSNALLPRSNPLYTKVAPIVAALVNTFKNEFPHLAGLPGLPIVMIVIDGETEPSAETRYSQPTSDEIPYLLVMNQALAEQSESAIQGVLAHEFVHLFLQPDHLSESFPKSRFFEDTNSRIDFGFQISNQEALENVFRPYVETVDTITPFSNVELGNFPLSFDSSGANFIRIYTQLFQHADGSPSCNTAETKFDELFDLAVDTADESDGLKLVLNDAQKIAVAEITATLQTASEECFASVSHASAADLYTEALGMLKIYVLGFMGQIAPVDSVADQFESRILSQNTISALFESTGEARELLRDVEAAYDFSKIKYYTSEDHADEIAVFILAKMNHSPEGLNSVLVSGGEVCNMSQEPKFGGLGGEHHAGCWRAFRNQSLYNYLVTPQ
jgi:hypothetical protein